MQVVFIPWKGIDSASSRMRCFWIVKYWPEAKVASVENMEDADVVVFQKCFQPPVAEYVRALKAKGRKVIWDLCDPDWWVYPQDFSAVVPYLDAVICCNDALAKDFVAEFPGQSPKVIPDRQDPAFHPSVKEHKPSEFPILVWFGWSQNRVALYSAFDLLEKIWAHGRRFKLLILDEDPNTKLNWFNFPVLHQQWNLERFHKDLLSADIALLPRYPGPRGLLKSDNKKATAMWAALPVTEGDALCLAV